MSSNKVKILVFLSISYLSSNLLFAQKKDNNAFNTMDFNGYIQIRGISNFDDYNSFSVRRLKFWIKSQPEFSEHWYYKIQTTFSSLLQEKFFLQDVKLGYKTGLFTFDIGQFVPQYSLQRFQPDYKIPAIERANVINALIPNGTIGVRDIGVQANLKSQNKILETHLGIFNGYGIKEYRFNNQGYMITHKTSFNFLLNKKNKFQIAYSLQYRKSENLRIPHVLPDSILFTGKDFRYNFSVRFNSKIFDIQAEYLNADFDGKLANGAYILSGININNRNQIVLSYEDYNDLISSTNDLPYYRLAYNYYINDYKIKLSVDNYFQIHQKTIEKYIASIQLQMFFK